MYCGSTSRFSMTARPLTATQFVACSVINAVTATGGGAIHANGSTYEVIGRSVVLTINGTINDSLVATNAIAGKTLLETEVSFCPVNFLPLAIVPFTVVCYSASTNYVNMPAFLMADGIIQMWLPAINNGEDFQMWFPQITYVLG